MLLDVSRIKREPGASYETPMTTGGRSLEQAPDVLESPVSLAAKVRVSNSNGMLVCHMEVELQVHMRCSRCLEAFPFARTVAFVEAFRERPGAGEMTLEERYHGEMNLFEGEELELDEVVRENLVASLPMKPVCSPDCAGLCPGCGQNLNRGACGCARDSIDPRLAALAQLLDHGQDE